MKKQLSAVAVILTLALSGAAYADNPPAGHEGMEGGPFKEALAKLPEKDATLVRDSLKQAHDQNKASYDQMHQLHQDMKAIMTAPTFDKDAYLAKEAQLQKLQDSTHTATTAALASAFAQLPQDERKSLSDAFGRHHWKHHGQDGQASSGTATK